MKSRKVGLVPGESITVCARSARRSDRLRPCASVLPKERLLVVGWDQRSSIRFEVAKSFCEIEQARLLTLKAADMMDRYGNVAAKDLIAAIKIVAPNVALSVIDRAIQVHGGLGVSDDFPMAEAWATNRYVRIADGPDEVHMYQLGKQKINEFSGN